MNGVEGSVARTLPIHKSRKEKAFLEQRSLQAGVLLARANYGEGIAVSTSASALESQPSPHEVRRYRYTFLKQIDDLRALAAVELVAESDEAAAAVANELLKKSDALIVEVWCAGQLVLHVAKTAPDDSAS